MKIGYLAVGLILASGLTFVSATSTDAQARSVYKAFSCTYHRNRSGYEHYATVFGFETPCPAAPEHTHPSHLYPNWEYSGPECIIREPFD